jgi:4-hydroxybenzoate polyprenyltransferase
MPEVIRILKLSWKLLRINTYFLIGLHVLLAFVLAGSSASEANFNETLGFNSLSLDLLIALVLSAIWYINATATNDLADYEIDQINLKDQSERLLVTGEGKKSDLSTIWRLSMLASLLLSAALSPVVIFLSMAVMFLNWAYSFKPIQVSYRGGLSQLLLPLGYVVYPVLLGFITSGASWNLEMTLLLAGLYMTFISRTLLKDFRDTKGDLKFGKMTFLLRHTPKTTTYLSWLALWAGAVALGILATLEGLNVTSMLIAMDMLPLTILMLQLSRLKSWSEQKKYIPFINRLTSFQTAFILFYIFYLSGDLNYMQYLMSSMVIGASVLYIYTQSPIVNLELRLYQQQQD